MRWTRFFEQIDAGEVPLGGDDGLLKAMLKAALERGLEVELTGSSEFSGVSRFVVRVRSCRLG